MQERRSCETHNAKRMRVCVRGRRAFAAPRLALAAGARPALGGVIFGNNRNNCAPRDVSCER